MEKYSILFVASDKGWIRKAAALLPGESFDVSTAQNAYVALEKASCHRYDALVAVLPLPLMKEEDFLRRLKRVDESLPVVTFSSEELGGDDVVRAAAESVSFSSGGETLREMVERALGDGVNRPRGKRSSRTGGGDAEASEIIGSSAEVRKILEMIELLKDGDIPILLQGESGTGKDLVARTIHFRSRRRDYPFVPVNCAAIPDALLESGLFGHEKGAFTGAVTRRIGKFEQANRGTLFLDEIAEMSRGTQAKLLRAIETREIERIGGSQRIRVDIRIICATNQDLYNRMEEGAFRRDLYYRIAGFQIILPPLRHRTEDIPVLVEHFLKLFGANSGRPVMKISPRVMSILLAHEWKGNVRELANVIHRACLLCTGDTILSEHLPPKMIAQFQGKGWRDVEEPGRSGTTSKIVPLRSLEAQAMKCALEEAGGNISAAARELGMGRATFYRKAQRYDIDLKGRN